MLKALSYFEEDGESECRFEIIWVTVLNYQFYNVTLLPLRPSFVYQKAIANNKFVEFDASSTSNLINPARQCFAGFINDFEQVVTNKGKIYKLTHLKKHQEAIKQSQHNH